MANNLKIQALSQVFSPSVFRQVVMEGEVAAYLNKVKKHSKVIKGFKPANNREALKQLYTFFNSNYRFEYIYKNTLINKLISEKKLSGTTVLNELKVGKSIADTVLINGEPILYEIKTELDNPEKLLTQIADYQKCFEKIIVVTHESVYYRYYQLLKGSPVGLSFLSHKEELIDFKPAAIYSDKLEHMALFKLLRKEEYSNIIEKEFGNIPDVPNTLFFRTCFGLAAKISLNDFYNAVHGQLKKREITELGFVNSDQTPKELKYICYVLGFNALEYQYLYQFLMQPYKP